jgi:Ca2+-transporting ATPase
MLRIGVLCSNASVGEEEVYGDPTEAGLLRGALAHGWTREALLEDAPEEREVAFDPELMMMATYHREKGGFFVAVKGAPDPVLDSCTQLDGEDGPQQLSDETREQWRERSESMADEGFRVLAGAWKRVDNEGAEPYDDLVFAGLFGLWDPPREDVPDSIADCQRAGIRAIMVTGDQPATAAAIGERIGLFGDDGREVMHSRDLKDPADMSREERERVLNTAVFARMTPEQKLWLIKVFQEEGHVVAMTGDGVNDTPALSKAEIGVAMGQRGTDAAKEAADMVLQDDDFPDIVSAVRQGRVIFGNIRKATLFMLCTNLAEILVVGIAAIVGWTLPLRPLQILYLNVLTDVFPALALGLGKGVPEVMDRPPRPAGESLLTRWHWAAVVGWAALVGACIFGAYFVARDVLGLGDMGVVTVSFLTLGAAKLWFPFNLRSRGTRVFKNDVVSNPWVWGAIAICLVLLAAALYVPGLKDVLQTEPLSYTALGVVLGFSLLPFIIGQTIRVAQRNLFGIKDGS